MTSILSRCIFPSVSVYNLSSGQNTGNRASLLSHLCHQFPSGTLKLKLELETISSLTGNRTGAR